MSETNEVLDTNTTAPTTSVQKETLPNAGGILTMGILSIVFAGLIGMILAIISLSLSGKAIAEYKNNPEKYTESSFKNVKAGKVCSIVGLSLLGLVILILIFVAIAGGF